MNRGTGQWQEEPLKARVFDAVRICALRGQPRFVGFLDEREAAVGMQSAKCTRDVLPVCFGGYEGAERTVLGIFPAWEEPKPQDFPILPVTVTFKSMYSLTHRDFLGTLMAMGIVRDRVGDILVGEGDCVLFLHTDVASFVLSQLTKVGGVGVRCSEGLPEALPAGRGFEELSGTIASARLDCLAAFLCHLSRGKAAELILLGGVKINHQPCDEPCAAVAQGDTLSVKGHGRFLIVQIGPATGKGRLRIKANKLL